LVRILLAVAMLSQLVTTTIGGPMQFLPLEDPEPVVVFNLDNTRCEWRVVDVDAPIESVFSGLLMSPVPTVLRLRAPNPLHDLGRLVWIEDALHRPVGVPAEGTLLFELAVDQGERVPFVPDGDGGLIAAVPVGIHSVEVIVTEVVDRDRTAGRYTLNFEAVLEPAE
jgi:hypothetical protein